MGLHPQPPCNEVSIGPFSLRAYGLVIAIGAIVAVRLAQRRWQARDGDSEDIATYHPTFLYEALWNLALACPGSAG